MQALQIEDNTPLLSAQSERKDGKSKFNAAVVAIVIPILALIGVITLIANQQVPVQVGRHEAVVGVASDVVHVPHGDYYLTQNVGNYEDAKKQCGASGGELASIHNDEENDKASALCSSSTSLGHQCWIGFTDKDSEGTWVWEDGSDNSYTMWNGNHEPNNVGGNEHCAVINWGTIKHWNDLPCTEYATKFKGMCQKIPTVDTYHCPPGTFDKQKYNEGQPCICEECPAGKYCEGYADGENQDPKPCRIGTYQPLKGQSQCDESPPGHKVPDAGSTHPTECPEGEYQNEYGQGHCKPCSKGHKCPGTANADPTQCNEGNHQDEEGQTTCKPCPTGNKCPNKGMIDPKQCHLGKYQPSTGETQCEECLVGHKCPNKGMDNPMKCPAEHFQPCTQQTVCIPCEEGMTTGGAIGQGNCDVTGTTAAP